MVLVLIARESVSQRRSDSVTYQLCNTSSSLDIFFLLLASFGSIGGKLFTNRSAASASRWICESTSTGVSEMGDAGWPYSFVIRPSVSRPARAESSRVIRDHRQLVIVTGASGGGLCDQLAVVEQHAQRVRGELATRPAGLARRRRRRAVVAAARARPAVL